MHFNFQFPKKRKLKFNSKLKFNFQSLRKTKSKIWYQFSISNFQYSKKLKIEIWMPIFLFQFFDSNKENSFNFWFVILTFGNLKKEGNKNQTQWIWRNYSCAFVIKASINALSNIPLPLLFVSRWGYLIGLTYPGDWRVTMLEVRSNLQWVRGRKKRKNNRIE